MEKVEKNSKVIKEDCDDLLQEKNLGWPVKFYVCKAHKEDCFKDYENAILDESRPCEVCHPKDNDSLGG